MFTSLDSVVAKVFKGKQFAGEFRKEVEEFIDDADWIFAVKTIRNSLQGKGAMLDRHLMVTVLLMASRIDSLGHEYKYPEFKDCMKGIQVFHALLQSFRGADTQYLYRRALESVTLALDLTASEFNTAMWSPNLEVAALALILNLEKDLGSANAALRIKTTRRSRKGDPTGDRKDA